MEKGHEEVYKEAEVKNFGVAVYDEVRLEVFLSSLLNELEQVRRYKLAGYLLNNIIIPGYRDIGLDGQAVFILRKVKYKNEADKRED